MSLDLIHNSIALTVQRHGDQLRRATSTGLTIGLVAAALLPVALGTLPLSAPVLAALGLAGSLGQNIIGNILQDILSRSKGKAKQEEDEVRAQLEQRLQASWDESGPTAAALRQEMSQVLQATSGVESALTAATGDLKQALAQGLAELSGSFDEFRWLLNSLKDILADIRTRQSLQLALQKEQLDLQRQQLIKLNLLIQTQASPQPSASISTQAEAEDDAAAPADVPCPYKGLAAFEAEDADDFFGRDQLVAQLVAHLAASRFLAVSGPSGTGKSSVVSAGLLPALWRGSLPGSQGWKTVSLAPGPHPLEELAVRLAVLTDLSPTVLLKDLQPDARGLDLAVRAALVGSPESARLVLFVDQFEEVFSLCPDEAERRAFIAALVHAARAEAGRTVVVISLRTDFYDRCVAYPELVNLLESNAVLVGPMSQAELRQVIERPAQRVGLRLERGLVATILKDAGEEPGTLPLVSHALVETWKRRRGRTLTLRGYTETGRVGGALAQTAEVVLAQFSDEQRTITRKLFLRLTQPGGDGVQDTRRRAAHGELLTRPEDAPELEAVLRKLADARLITLSQDTVEVAHEALIREWPTLRRWLDENREGLRLHRQLTADAQEWARLGRDPGALYRGVRLAAASEWAEAHVGELNTLEREFVEASRTQQAGELERERKRTAQVRRRAWYLAGAFVVALLFAGGTVYFGVQADAAARRNADLAATAQAEAAARATAEAVAVEQRDEAQRQTILAVSRQLAAQALTLLDNHPDVSLLLSMEAYRWQDTFEARNSLLTGLLHDPYLVAFLHGPGGIVAVSPDSKLLASGGSGEVILWEVESRQPLGEPIALDEGEELWSLAFSPDGTTLAAGGCAEFGLGNICQRGWVRLWDVQTGQPLGPVLARDSTGITSVAFSPEGKTLAANNYVDGIVFLWDVTDPRAPVPAGQLTGHITTYLATTGLAFSPDGRILAAGSCHKPNETGILCSEGEVYLWDVATRQPLGAPLVGHANWVVDVAFSPDGATLASGSVDTTLLLWDMQTRQPVGAPLAGHTDWVTEVAFSPDGQILASGSVDTTIILWNVQTRQPLVPPLTGQAYDVSGVALGADGLLVSASSDGMIMLRNLQAQPTFGSILSGHSAEVNSLTVSPDGKLWASGSCAARKPDQLCEQGEIRLWDAHTRQLLGQPLAAHQDEVTSLAFSPTGRLLASFGGDRILLWDVSDPVKPIQLGQVPDKIFTIANIAFSSDGQLLAVGYAEAYLLWNIADPTSPTRLNPPQGGQADSGLGGGVISLAFSPDGRILATGNLNDAVILWDVQKGTPLGPPLTGLEGKFSVGALAFSPDARIVAANSGEAILLWDISTPEAPTLLGAPLRRHGEDVLTLAFSPDGKTLASGSRDRTIILWDVETQQPLGLPLTGHTHRVSRVAYSPDGQTLISASFDTTLMVWEVAPEAWQARACRMANRNLTQAEWKQYLPGLEYSLTCAQWPVGK